MMRNSYLTTPQDLKKTTSSHFKRYSEHDLKTTSINNLLITQSNAFSQLKFRSLKTKLPQITTSTQSFSNSHSKVGRITDTVNELAANLEELNEDLQNLRMSFDNQKRNIEDRLDKSNSTLGSKVQRLSTMLDYAIAQDKKRSRKIEADCDSLRESTRQLKGRVDEIRMRVKRVEDQMGLYTGQDKYLL